MVAIANTIVAILMGSYYVIVNTHSAIVAFCSIKYTHTRILLKIMYERIKEAWSHDFIVNAVSSPNAV